MSKPSQALSAHGASWVRQLVLVGLVASSSMLPRQACALIVMNTDPAPYKSAPTTENLVGPWGENVDPGWANITEYGVYLGNGWVLSAKHTFLDSGESRGTSDIVNGESFNIIEGSRWALKNPKVLTSNTYVEDSQNVAYSAEADLKLYRLNSLAGGTVEQRAALQGLTVQPIVIGSQSLGSVPGEPEPDLVILGNGPTRNTSGNLRHADTDIAVEPSWPVPTACTACFHLDTAGSSYPDSIAPDGDMHAVGYLTIESATTRLPNWGTNKLEPVGYQQNGGPTPGSVLWSLHQKLGTDDHYFQREIDPISGEAHYALITNGGDVVAQAFDFDEHTFTLDANGNVVSGGGGEARAAGGDSGSGVFAWDNASSSWQLHGVLHSVEWLVRSNVAGAINRDNGTAPDIRYGDLTFFSDLPVYKDQIDRYLAPPEGFEWTGTGPDTRFFHLLERAFIYDSSGNVILDPANPGENDEGLWGDINLDGRIWGDGTGDPASDDLAAFAQGWGYSQASGDIFSWKQGDLNQDGTTGLEDFLLLRRGYQAATGQPVSLSALVGGSPQIIPEPSALLLAGAAAGVGLAVRRRSKRPRAA